MGKGKWIDKKSAVSFKLVHRPQNDPLIHDETAPSMVLAPTAGSSSKPGSKSVTTRSDIASQLGSEVESIRDNEGEAAIYGVYYDDSSYDYMQHLREPGTLGSGVVYMDAKDETKTQKGKGKGQSLEQALKQMDLSNQSEELFDEEMLPSKNLERLTYQNQQDIQDSIAGFQPDMDPDLREVLEALDDDAYVDDQDDIFQELAKDAKELKTHEFTSSYDDDEFWEEDDGWASDATEKPTNQPRAEPDESDDVVPDLVRTTPAPDTEPTPDRQNPDWMDDFQQFKQGQRQKSIPRTGAGSSVVAGETGLTARRKKRKGALTNPSSYSMTSSSLARTDQQRALDDRFEARLAKIEQEMDDRMTMSSMGMSTVTTAPPEDFGEMVDDFLQGYKPKGKSRKAGNLPPGGRKAANNRGVAELDDIRKGLGPARVKVGK